jgi:putative PIN family toxin of toxin-antitoxin system
VIISSLLFEGSNPDLAIRYALQNGNILFSLELIEEIDEVLSRAKFRKYITDEEREEFLDSFIDRGILIEVVDVVKECRDAKDDKILELSLSGKADLIISGDKDLLVLNPFRSIQIQSVEQFLKSVGHYPPNKEA